MRVLFCGDREWRNSTRIMEVFNLLQPSILIEGECRGADKMARVVAEWRGMSVKDGTILPFPAQWSRFGKPAGVLRNTQMIKEGKPDLVVGFNTHIETSRGTANMLTQAEDAGILYCLVDR